MLERAPFSWLDSNGWLVLSGTADALSEIRAQALSRYNTVGAIAYISLAEDLGDALMDDMAELGAPTGYLVDLEEQDNNAIYERLSTAGMIVIEAAGNAEQLMSLMTQTATHAIKSALDCGGLILFEGAAAAIAGEHILSANGKFARGLSFVRNALIAPAVAPVEEDGLARNIQRVLPEASIIGLAHGSALALGPAQRIETWGDGDVMISLSDPMRSFDRSKAVK